jgi:hypothetical protein
VLFAVSPSVFPALSLLVLDLLREEVLEPPELFAVLSVRAASFESVFFLVLVFFEVVAFSPELASEDFAASVESAADFFFFFFVAVESLCDWSVDCGDRRPALACVALVRPQVSNNVINTADQELFFISVPASCAKFLCHSLLSCAFHAPLVIGFNLKPAVIRLTTRQDVLHRDVSQYRRACSSVG